MAILNPNIRGYAPLYIQRDSDNAAVDIKATYGVVIKQHNYPIQMKVKEPYKNGWKDEHGDDEAKAPLHIQATEVEYECAILSQDPDSATARSELSERVRTFRKFLISDYFKMWDDYTKFGFTDVRLEEIPQPDENAFKALGTNARVIFKMRIKVNDPLTEVQFSNGVISIVE